VAPIDQEAMRVGKTYRETLDRKLARRKERRAQEPAYRERENARSRAYYHAHKEDMQARQRAYRRANSQQLKTAHRADQLDRLYGMSLADYHALLARQGGACAICGERPQKVLSVDHCHSTGTIRGLLCRTCNTGLGCLKDDQVSLLVAFAYLAAADGDGLGSAARRARLVRTALPPGPARKAILTKLHVPFRFDAPPRAPSGSIGRRTSTWRPISRGEAVLLTNSSTDQATEET
jgi:hypothetical protein